MQIAIGAQRGLARPLQIPLHHLLPLQDFEMFGFEFLRVDAELDEAFGKVGGRLQVEVKPKDNHITGQAVGTQHACVDEMGHTVGTVLITHRVEELDRTLSA